MNKHKHKRLIAFAVLIVLILCFCAEALAIRPVKGPQGVIYGRRLTKNHAHGDRSSVEYGASDIKDGSGSAFALKIADGVPEIVLDNGESSFEYEVAGDTVFLTPTENGKVWTVPAGTLDPLRISGRKTVVLRLNEKSMDIPTNLEPVGREWGKLRTKGYVWAQCMLLWDGSSLLVDLDGIRYDIGSDGLLSQAKEDQA